MRSLWGRGYRFPRSRGVADGSQSRTGPGAGFRGRLERSCGAGVPVIPRSDKCGSPSRASAKPSSERQIDSNGLDTMVSNRANRRWRKVHVQGSSRKPAVESPPPQTTGESFDPHPDPAYSCLHEHSVLGRLRCLIQSAAAAVFGLLLASPLRTRARRLSGARARGGGTDRRRGHRHPATRSPGPRAGHVRRSGLLRRGASNEE